MTYNVNMVKRSPVISILSSSADASVRLAFWKIDVDMSMFHNHLTKFPTNICNTENAVIGTLNLVAITVDSNEDPAVNISSV
jgi:hypothetical protein